MSACRAHGFGLLWAADIALDGFDPAPPDDARAPDVHVARVPTLPDRGAGRTVNAGTVHADGVRFAWNDEVVFDMWQGTRIDYLPGPAWRGALPPAFYGTLAALTLAWRGTLPFHACMVEVAGRAVLIAGRSGAGKSSLTAGLIGIGARLVADDLSAVRIERDQVVALRGRPTMRQHRDTAHAIAADLRAPIPGDARGKWLVRPQARSTAAALPLGGILALTEDRVVDARAKIALLAAHLFRPRWLAAMPGDAARRRDLLTIAATVPLRTLPPIATFDPHDQRARADRAHALIGEMLQPRLANTKSVTASSADSRSSAP